MGVGYKKGCRLLFLWLVLGVYCYYGSLMFVFILFLVMLLVDNCCGNNFCQDWCCQVVLENYGKLCECYIVVLL